MSKQLLLVAHAPSPNTERLRDAITTGVAAAESKDIELVVRSPFDARASSNVWEAPFSPGAGNCPNGE